MTILWATVLVLINGAWGALNLLLLPGNWMMVATTLLVAWWRWDAAKPASQQMFSVPVLVAVVVLAAAGEVLELLAGSAGVRTARGSRGAAAGALFGGVAGAIVGTFAIPIPVVGSLVGACGGACPGAWFVELTRGRRMDHCVRAGVGAGVGRLMGTLAKVVIGVVIWMLIAAAAYWP